MTYWSRYSRIAIGLGSSSSLTSLVSASSSSMISLHRSMHSSQIYTPGPAISLRTCFWLFPQKEHLSRSPPSPMRAMCPLDLLCVEPSRTRCLATVLTLPARHVEVACLSVTTRTRSVGGRQGRRQRRRMSYGHLQGIGPDRTREGKSARTYSERSPKGAGMIFEPTRRTP